MDEDLRAIPFLDRGVIGADWLATSTEPIGDPAGALPPKRIVFFGIKGGGGRTTALCISARHFAKQGLKVLVLDMDLESPGLGSLLLPPSEVPPSGIIDWFVEDGLEQSTPEILDQMISVSSLGAPFQGSIQVMPAFGRDESGYISKLSRVYADLARPGMGEHQTFADRFLRMLYEIENRMKPDVVLLDSRAGMHDIAAALLVRVPGALRLLFAHHFPQTWAGYQLLFKQLAGFSSVSFNFPRRSPTGRCDYA